MVRVSGPCCHRESLQTFEVDLAQAPLIILGQNSGSCQNILDGRQQKWFDRF